MDRVSYFWLLFYNLSQCFLTLLAFGQHTFNFLHSMVFSNTFHDMIYSSGLLITIILKPPIGISSEYSNLREFLVDRLVSY